MASRTITIGRCIMLISCLMGCTESISDDRMASQVATFKENLNSLETRLSNRIYRNDNFRGEYADKIRDSIHKIDAMERSINSHNNQISQYVDIIRQIESKIKENKNNLLLSANDMKELETIIEENKNEILLATNNRKELGIKIGENEDDIIQSTNNRKEIEIKLSEKEVEINDITAYLKEYKDCNEFLKGGHSESGVQTIFPFHGEFLGVEAYCDQSYSDGGWTVIQRRDDLDVREDFFRGWEDYEAGFGNVTGEYWLGLKTIHALTTSRPMELMIRLEAFDGDEVYANYHTFSVGDSDENYKLTINGYRGDSGDSFSFHDGHMFTTKDNDNDEYTENNCSIKEKGAWWYYDCAGSNLNGPAEVGTREFQSMYWVKFKNSQPLKRTVMMVRPLPINGEL